MTYTQTSIADVANIYLTVHPFKKAFGYLLNHYCRLIYIKFCEYKNVKEYINTNNLN